MDDERTNGPFRICESQLRRCDDLSMTLQEHLKHLRTAIEPLSPLTNVRKSTELISQNELKFKISGQAFAKRSTSLLKRIIDKTWVRADPCKLQAIQENPCSINDNQKSRLLRDCWILQTIHQIFADMSEPLHAINLRRRGFV